MARYCAENAIADPELLKTLTLTVIYTTRRLLSMDVGFSGEEQRRFKRRQKKPVIDRLCYLNFLLQDQNFHHADLFFAVPVR
jgi:hypothetical protein